MIEAIIFDYGRTLADGQTNTLFPQALPLLDKLLERGFKMALVSRTSNPDQRRNDLERLGLKKYFQALEIFSANETKEFSNVFKDLDVKPNDTLVVGDRIKSEIVEGNRAGAKTLWVRQGKFADELPESDEEKPDFTVTSLSKVLDIIDSLMT